MKWSRILSRIMPVKIARSINIILSFPTFSRASGISSIIDRAAIVPKAIEMESSSIVCSFLADLAISEPKTINIPSEKVNKIPIYVVKLLVLNFLRVM